MKQPSKYDEVAPAHIAGKTNFFIELIECLLLDTDCNPTYAQRLLERLKRYKKAAKYKRPDYNTSQLVWEQLKTSEYIDTIVDYLAEISQNKKIEFSSDDYLRMYHLDAEREIPTSIRHWEKQLRLGISPKQMLENILPILKLIRSA